MALYFKKKMCGLLTKVVVGRVELVSYYEAVEKGFVKLDRRL